MTRFIAALPMYDWPELHSSVDAEWAGIRERLLRACVEAPPALARRNADLPPVPGGIRDPGGRIVAPDPASLPPDELDLATLWRHPDLLVAQACWGPIETGLADHVEVVGQPLYSGIEGGQGIFYSSAIIMRRDPLEDHGPRDVHAPAGGRPLVPADRMRGKRLAFNAPDSMSGIIALSRDLEAIGESIDMFGERILTGSHRASIAAVAGGSADVCAVDCRTWQIARAHEPAAAGVRVVGWTRLRKGLPMIASKRVSPAVLKELRAILSPDLQPRRVFGRLPFEFLDHRRDRLRFERFAQVGSIHLQHPFIPAKSPELKSVPATFRPAAAHPADSGTASRCRFR